MTREEAAQLLWRVAYDKYGLDDNPTRQREAADIVVTALREKQQRQPGWVKTADRVPTEADGLTICVGENENGELIEQAGWSYAKKQSKKMRDDFMQKGYLYWLPLPPLPETVGSEGTKINGGGR